MRASAVSWCVAAIEGCYRTGGSMAKAILIASAALYMLAVVPAAFADTRPPPNPSIAQYVELVPTSGGAVVPTGRSRVRLSKHVVEQLPKGAEGTALREIRQPRPTARLSASSTRPSAQRSKPAAPRWHPKPTFQSATFSAAVDAVGADPSLALWLGIVLLATAAFGAGAAVARARR